MYYTGMYRYRDLSSFFFLVLIPGFLFVVFFGFCFMLLLFFFGRVMQRYERVKMRIIIVLSLVYYIVCINRYRYFEIKLKACKVNLT